jgi:hypothetical protein
MGAVATQHAGIASGINNAVARTAGLLAVVVLGLVVAATFETTLDSRVTSLHVDPTVKQAIDRQRARLAGIQVPPDADTTARAAVIQAIDTSFVTGFRVAMFVAAGLALASGLVAGLMVEGTATSAAMHVPEQRLTWKRLTVVDSADFRRRCGPPRYLHGPSQPPVHRPACGHLVCRGDDIPQRCN